MIGFGAVGHALARMFTRNRLEVAVASGRPPEALAAPHAKATKRRALAEHGRQDHRGEGKPFTALAKTFPTPPATTIKRSGGSGRATVGSNSLI